MSNPPKAVSRRKVKTAVPSVQLRAAGAITTPRDLFEPMEREPAYTRVCSAIEAKILARELRDGDMLPPEIDLARQFQVHRSTVREALRQLESAGLVRRGGKRLLVSRPHTNKVAAGMKQALVLHDVRFVDVWEAMMVIEPEVAALAAVRRDAATFAALELAHARFVASPGDDAASAVAAVEEFFELIGMCAHNHVLVLAKHSLTMALGPSLAKMIDKLPQARARIADAQRRIIAALHAKDATEARKWMARHVRDFKRGYEVGGISPDTPISV
jgi:GntR family transcriptional regulator, transcriptional repressor for pyruvate dehydrogenase complex